MSDLAIRVDNLGKRYQIGERERYYSLRDVLARAFTTPFRRLTGDSKSGIPTAQSEYIWALKDVSFEVKRSEVIGVIGRNGAGKSTLLKILSRITMPTEGRAEIHGRVGSLLEVGTGFHPELTGRENLYLNGAILGMRKAEIDSKFDEMVAFAEVEKFIDTPVKRYSTGMYVRLAFAVAAHLEPEILLVDEVLAVGDASFQKKCLGRMGKVAREGKTVLFVSHNMASILKLCDRAVLLHGGNIRADGPASAVVGTYIESGMEKTAEVMWDLVSAPGGEIARMTAVRILNEQGKVCEQHYLSQPVTLEMEFWCFRSDIRLNPHFHVYNAHGICVFATSNLSDGKWGTRQYRRGLYRARCIIPANLLNEGQYRVSAIVVRDNTIVLARQEEVVSFHMNDDGSGRGDHVGTWIGVIRPILSWKVEILEAKVS